jgi:hypothetical protein
MKLPSGPSPATQSRIIPRDIDEMPGVQLLRLSTRPMLITLQRRQAKDPHPARKNSNPEDQPILEFSSVNTLRSPHHEQKNCANVETTIMKMDINIPGEFIISHVQNQHESDSYRAGIEEETK